MASDRVFQLLVLSCLLCVLPAFVRESHLFVAPQSPMLVIGTNFTATCVIINTTEVTAEDLYWILSKKIIPKEQYTKINSTALNVTVPVTSEKPEWLTCYSKRVSIYVVMNEGKFIHGTPLIKGYLPEKPKNLTCILTPKEKGISGIISCAWDPVGRQTTALPTTYKLNVSIGETYNFIIVEPHENSAEVEIDIIPYHMLLDIWVEVKNGLGSVQSEHLLEEPGKILKTNPPSNVTVNSEKNFSETLLIIWNPSIEKYYTNLIYNIRYCQYGSDRWTYVPLNDTGKDIQSFRLQNLKPDTVYVIQLCCKSDKEGHGYWSDWSVNATKRTPVARPSSKPDVWRIISEDGERRVQIICKDPVFANGRIQRFNLQIKDQKHRNMNGSWESVQVNRSEDGYSPSQREITNLKTIPLPDKQVMVVHVTATNSEGTSPEASLGFSDRADVFPPVKELKVWPHAGRLWLEWTPPNSSKAVSEYVIEWVSGGRNDWQRENGGTTHTAIKGKLEKFVRYNVSVYPLYSKWIGKQASKEAFLEQGAPLVGPTVGVNGKPGRSSADLVWEELPLERLKGFITNYTIFYTSGAKIHAIVVPANSTSYTLTSLERSTKYDTWVQVSTIGGSFNGSHHSFSTPKYDPGQIEGIVVGVCLGFLFVFLLTMLLCVYKKDVIKENFWPRIPNPGESTIGNWSPDYPLKAETPKENCLSGISVLDVDVCDATCVFEEDKTSLPLKKDKYLSEEHSSGIGGSSCMSSPRQSVSDSDEGGDMADTTASTVQYSSVVASNGYKGQTPNLQPQQAFFSRSESTQPLLDSEENPDMLLQDGRRMPCFTQTASSQDSTNPADFLQLEIGRQEVLEPLGFCPMEENTDQTVPRDRQLAEWMPAASSSSYMPQLGGYRPQ